MSDIKTALIEIVSDLIGRASVSPEDAGCQVYISSLLTELGFHCTELNQNATSNLWAELKRPGPTLVFAGHTDVVPAGELQQWHSQPYQATVINDVLYGRGAADMKGSLAAMLVATRLFLQQHPQSNLNIGFAITSDEEGDATDGTTLIVDWLKSQQRRLNYCVVGEPTCSQQLGDTIKIGRRGSLSGRLTVYGVQGHVAYPDLSDNAIHKIAPLLTNLAQLEWPGSDNFPTSCLQISNIHGGTGAGNVIPGRVTIDFNIRYNPKQQALALQTQIEEMVQLHATQYDLTWRHSAKPFLSTAGKLAKRLQNIIRQQLSISSELSTSGGTSDARFLIDVSDELVEFGPINASIHQANEHIALTDLVSLAQIYFELLCASAG